MSSARFEIEKRKLEYKIRQKEQGAFGGLGSWLLGAMSGSSSTKSLPDTLTESLKVSADQFLESPDKLDTIFKAASLLKNPKRSSLGTVVLGSIIGGILASRYYYKENQQKPVKQDAKELLP